MKLPQLLLSTNQAVVSTSSLRHQGLVSLQFLFAGETDPMNALHSHRYMRRKQSYTHKHPLSIAIPLSKSTPQQAYSHACNHNYNTVMKTFTVANVCADRQTHIYTYIYAHTHAYIHAHTHTQIHRCHIKQYVQHCIQEPYCHHRSRD